ncbi:uncharacterized protein LOC115216727, partial [Argonauta hians]
MTARGLHESCKGPYPGFEPDPNQGRPVSHMRVRPEAEEYATKHKGSLNLFESSYFSGSSGSSVKLRCPSRASRENLVYGQQGSVSKIIHCEATPRPDTHNQSRIRPEAEAIAESQKGHDMASLLVPSHNGEREKVKNYESNWKISKLLHHSSTEPASYRPAPRVKPEAEGTAQAAKGATMAAILGSSKQSKPVPTVYHIKNKTNSSYLWERAMGNINKGGQMWKVLSSSYPEVNTGPGTRVKREGQRMSQLDRGGRMNKLIYDTSALPTPIQPAPRCGISKVAKKIIHQNRGTVGSVLKNLASHQIILQPGVRG